MHNVFFETSGKIKQTTLLLTNKTWILSRTCMKEGNFAKCVSSSTTDSYRFGRKGVWRPPLRISANTAVLLAEPGVNSWRPKM
jgi:hypothetical protein